MLSQLLHELSLVPMWALLMLANFAAAAFCAVWIIHDPDSRSNARTALVALALVVIAAVVGAIMALAFAALHAIESRAWRARTSPARRIH